MNRNNTENRKKIIALKEVGDEKFFIEYDGNKYT